MQWLVLDQCPHQEQMKTWIKYKILFEGIGELPKSWALGRGLETSELPVRTFEGLHLRVEALKVEIKL